MSSRVLLLHGLWMPSLAMRWFAARLRAEGFAPEVFGYASIVGGPARALPRLRERLQANGGASLVAHSLGGLIALEALARDAERPSTRLVCLGTPLCGSGAAEALARWPLTALYLGRSAELLRRGCVDWPQRVEVGMIAGSIPRGLGALVARFEGAHDGTVAVAETRHPRLRDHVVVPAAHSSLIFSRAALRHTVAFLRRGRFDAAAAGPL